MHWGMNIGIYNSATTLSSLERWQDATSQNIAAGNVPGYKGNQMSFESIHAGMVGLTQGSRSIQSPNMMAVSDSRFNFAAGQLQQTEVPTHVAINGEGFFKIEGEGFDYFTRDGEFHINAENQLVNKNGHRVLGPNGPITINPQLGEVSISARGEVFQGALQSGRIAVVDTAQKDALVRMTGGFRFDPLRTDAVMQDVEDANVIQGSLEGSNINPLKEMVNLISISRAFEVNHKVIQSLDEIQAKTIEVMGATT